MPRAVLEDEQYEVRVPRSSNFEKPQGLTKRPNKKGANTKRKKQADGKRRKVKAVRWKGTRERKGVSSEIHR